MSICGESNEADFRAEEGVFFPLFSNYIERCRMGGKDCEICPRRFDSYLCIFPEHLGQRISWSSIAFVSTHLIDKVTRPCPGGRDIHYDLFPIFMIDAPLPQARSLSPVQHHQPGAHCVREDNIVAPEAVVNRPS